MQQIDQGIKSLLKSATIYNLFQHLIGGTRARKRCIQEFVRPTPQMRLLDIGCGPGTLIHYLPPSTQYYGIDISQNYITQGKERFGDRGTFICGDLNNNALLKDLPKFDLVLGMGVLHHLEDTEVKLLFQSIKKIMAPAGRLITLDGCYTENQSRIAKFLLNQDRGKNVRTEAGYRSLTNQIFGNVKITLLNDMLHVPYTIAIMECS